MIELSLSGQHLFDMLMQLPPDLERVRSFLQEEKCTADDVNRAALRFVEECWEEGVYPWDTIPNRSTAIGDYYWEEARLIPNLHSSHLYQVIEMLLAYGLDPNVEIDETSLIEEMPHIVNEYVGADTLALLFEHGADPFLKLHSGESVFLTLDFDVAFDAIEQNDRRRYEALVHSWLIFIGYGARLEDGRLPMELFIPRESDFHFEISDFKQHRNYYVGLSHVRSQGKAWSLHVFDRRTMWEVARF